MRLNFFSVSVVILLLIFLLAPAIGLAQGEQEQGLKVKIEELYDNVVNIAFPIAVVILIFAGYMYITSTGNPETLGMAKNLIFGVISGLIVLLLAGLILETVGQTAVHTPSTGSSSPASGGPTDPVAPAPDETPTNPTPAGGP